MNMVIVFYYYKRTTIYHLKPLGKKPRKQRCLVLVIKVSGFGHAQRCGKVEQIKHIQCIANFMCPKMI